jgi:hypothetical protein
MLKFRLAVYRGNISVVRFEIMKRIIIPAIMLLLSGSSFAQQGFRMVTGEPLNSRQERLEVRGRNGILINQKLRIGDHKYFTTSVKRSAIRKWTSQSGFIDFIWTEHVVGRQSIHYRLTNGTDTSDVLTLTNIASNDLIIGSDPNALPNVVSSVMRIGTEDQKNNFSAALYLSKNDEPWQLFLDNTTAQLHREDYIGYVTRGDEYYSIVPVWKLEKKGKVRDIPFGEVGFEIRNKEGQTIAATSLMDNGEVYMGETDSKEQFLMANVCAALLLQTNIAE